MSNKDNARYKENERENRSNASTVICFEVRATTLRPRLHTMKNQRNVMFAKCCLSACICLCIGLYMLVIIKIEFLGSGKITCNHRALRYTLILNFRISLLKTSCMGGAR